MSKWIKNVTDHMDKGSFRGKAEKAGKSTGAYAREHENDSGKLGKQARLAETLMKIQQGHHKKMASHSKIRKSMYED